MGDGTRNAVACGLEGRNWAQRPRPRASCHVQECSFFHLRKLWKCESIGCKLSTPTT